MGKSIVKNLLGFLKRNCMKLICRGISKVIPERGEILSAVKATLEYAVSGNNDNLDRFNLELNIKQLQNEADELMTNAISTGGDKERYFEEIEKIYSKIKALREKFDSLQSIVVETPECNKEIKRITEFLENEAFEMKEYDDTIIRRIVDCIKVMSDKTIVIILKGGFEITEKLT
mgnify:CR=1 FL=1|jgi:site-specific DNA recombinase